MSKSSGRIGKYLPLILGIFGLVSTGVLLGISINIITLFSKYLVDAWAGFITAIIVSCAIVTITWLMDRNRNLWKRFQQGEFNFKWLIISAFIFIVIIGGILIFFMRTDMTFSDFDFDIDDAYVADFAFYSISSILLTTIGLGILFGIKNILQREPAVKIKQVFYAFCSLLLVIGAPVGMYFIDLMIVDYNVADKFNWNDGPWLTWDDDPSSTIEVSWLTKSPTTTSIYLGTDQNDLTEITLNSTKTLIHHAKLTDLNPDTEYYYRINQKFTNYDRDEIFSFTTASNIQTAFSFAVVGDMQPSDDRTMQGGDIVARGIDAIDPDFVVQVGDVASSGGSILNWHNVLTNIPKFASERPIQSIIGNHDYGGDNGTNFETVFPYDYAAESQGDTGYYYSFDYMNAHFVMVDNFNTYHYTMTDKHKLWVENDIDAAQADGQEWIFIFFHHTILTTGTSGMNMDLQQWLMPLADAEDIDGVFFGHDHHYEHWNYTYGNQGVVFEEGDTPQGNAVNYWCTGGGGAHLEIDYNLLGHSTYSNDYTWYNMTAGATQTINYQRDHWNENRYIDHTDNPEYGQLIDGKHYYHAPSIENYANYTDLYGYDYGEQSLHFMLVEIDGSDCTISTRYPNGDLMQGPSNAYPQTWSFSK